jgi:NADH dehydrogenase FAD-containing subunit
VAFDVVIAGGGFGGLYAARRLEPRHVVVPLREELEWADLMLGRVTAADPGVNELYVRTLDERDETRRYDYRTLGVFVDMGRNKAVATVLGIRLRGFPAVFATRTYHLAVMPGFVRRVRLGIDWAVGLVFGRASAELPSHPAGEG